MVRFQNLLPDFLNRQFRGIDLTAIHHGEVAVVNGVVPALIGRLDGKITLAAQFPCALFILCLNLWVIVGSIAFHHLSKLADVEHIAQTTHVKMVIVQIFQP